MGKVIILTGKTEKGFCGTCNLIPGWIVSYTGDFEGFKKEVAESIQFYLDCAKQDNEKYPAIFDTDYETEYKFHTEVIL